MRIPRIKNDPTRPGRRRRADHHGQRRDALVGRLVAVRLLAGGAAHGPRPARTASCGSPTDGQLPIPDDPALDFTMRPGWWTGMGMLHHAVRPRAQRGLRPAQVRVPALGRRGAVPAGPAGGRRAAGQDPHRRVDAGGHQPPDDGVRAAGQLVRRRGGADRPHLRPDQRQRGDQRHPGRGDRALRRAVLAHRGVHQRLPDAPAAARRLRPAVGGRRPARWRSSVFRELAGPHFKEIAANLLARGPLLLVRDDAPRGDRAAQLPEVPAGVRAAGRQGHRPRLHRHRADPRARRPPVLRVPPAAAPEGAGVLRRADRRRRAGRATWRSSTATSRRST